MKNIHVRRTCRAQYEYEFSAHSVEPIEKFAHVLNLYAWIQNANQIYIYEYIYKAICAGIGWSKSVRSIGRRVSDLRLKIEVNLRYGVSPGRPARRALKQLLYC